MKKSKIELGTQCFKSKLDTNISMELKSEMQKLGIEIDIQKRLLNSVDIGINAAMYEFEDEPQGISIFYDDIKINNGGSIFGNPENIYKRCESLQKSLDE